MTGPYPWSWRPPKSQNDAAPNGTSEVAAQRIAVVAAPLRERILAAIVEAGAQGLTDDEGEALLTIKPQTYTPRRGELVRRHLVVDSGERRPTSSGRPAAVWIDARLADSALRMAPAASSAAVARERGGERE